MRILDVRQKELKQQRHGFVLHACNQAIYFTTTYIVSQIKPLLYDVEYGHYISWLCLDISWGTQMFSFPTVDDIQHCLIQGRVAPTWHPDNNNANFILNMHNRRTRNRPWVRDMWINFIVSKIISPYYYYFTLIISVLHVMLCLLIRPYHSGSKGPL